MILVQISGTDNSGQFCAGMELELIDEKEQNYRIIAMAPKLKKHFWSPIKISNIKTKCNKERWQFILIKPVEGLPYGQEKA